jgi:hypothetical protein
MRRRNKAPIPIPSDGGAFAMKVIGAGLVFLAWWILGRVGG